MKRGQNVVITARVPSALNQKITHWCESDDTTKSQLVRGLLSLYEALRDQLDRLPSGISCDNE
jgi:hypothetical protein